MSELKPCANCAGEATRQAPNMHRKTCIACKECGMSTGWGTAEEVTATWNRRAQPANEPLMLEQLREMDGEPVWTVNVSSTKDGTWEMWDIVEKSDDEGIEFGYSTEYKEWWNYNLRNSDGTLCGCSWIAYRCPPERSENDG